MTAAEAFAPAKINLTLHVTGRRAGGYHELDSLVIFADIGDRITVRPAPRTRLRLSGPMAAGLPRGRRNLAVAAAELMDAAVEIHLEKTLPPAAGIGGGSADAAAVLRALSRLTGRPVPATGAVLKLGADVPVCMSGTPARMRGIGDRVQRIGGLPDLPMILANPGVRLPTGAVFAALESAENPPMTWPMPAPARRPAWMNWLRAQRNDLEAPARRIEPAVGAVLTALHGCAGCELARMSGSGATCFAIFSDPAARDLALGGLRAAYPGWWMAPSGPAAR